MHSGRLLAAAAAIISSTTTLGESHPEVPKSVIYHDGTENSPALNREAKKAYEGKFHVVEVTAKDGFNPGGMKGSFTSSFRFRDPRSMRDAEISGTIIYAFVVTPNGKVIEPRILHSTDSRVSKYILQTIIYDRFFPPRLRGAPVYALHVEEWQFGGPDGSSKQSGDGLGINKSRDR
jgi:hypothetical protein